MPPATVTPKKMPFQKYQRCVPVVLHDRTWPNDVIEQAPRCGAASTCATATRRSSTRWTRSASGACSTRW